MTAVALRVSDIVTVYGYFRTKGFTDISVAGLESSARHVAATMPFLEGLKRGIIDLSRLDLNEDDYVEEFYLPGFLGMGGFETCFKLCGGIGIVAFNGKDTVTAETLRALCESEGRADSLSLHPGMPESFV